jgi:hypothetical protein
VRGGPGPFRVYELDLSCGKRGVTHETLRLKRRKALIELEQRLGGPGDPWSFVDAADRAWAEGSRDCAVEYEDD